MKIDRIEISDWELPLSPPFLASWDSAPRKNFLATIVRVVTDKGLVGIGSGDKMYGFEDYAHLFLGTDSLDVQRHHAILDNIGFHAGRCWPLDLALWDLLGKAKELPVYQLLGNKTNQVRAYASTGTLRAPSAMAEQAIELKEKGFQAIKIRFGRREIQQDLNALKAVTDAVGKDTQIMVDMNQGWRMAWDIQPPYNVQTAIEVCREVEQYGVFWIEEPLHRGDYAGMRKLRELSQTRIAGGEMTREPYEFHELIEQQCLDVLQPDAAITGGITGLRKIAEQAAKRNLIFSPHTWGNGIGLIANAHLTAGTVGTPYLEFPIDPPEWTCERRDFMLEEPLKIDSQGYLNLSDKPGLGIELLESGQFSISNRRVFK